MKIFAIHNNTGSRHYRLIPQLKYIQSLGHEVILEPHNCKHIAQKIDWADIVIFQMVFSEEWVKYAEEKGKKIFFEMDDLIHTVPKTHYSYKETKGWGKVKWLWRIYKVLRLCDGLIVTNENLSKIYGWMTNSTFVFKNYIDLEHWLKEYKPNTTKRIRILWAGSTSHTGDLKMIKPVIKKILDKYPQVQFIYVGHGGIKSSDKQALFIHGEDIFEGLNDNRESMLSVPANVWPYILSTLQADIAIAPLEKNYFNKFKSQCKFLEYSINKIPCVASKWFYTDIEHGKTGFLAETEDEWIKYLQILIENDIMRNEMKENAYQYALTQEIRGFLPEWANYIGKPISESIKS